MIATEQINQYISEQPEWQRKLLVRLRQLIHATHPDVEEMWRWNAPHFDSNDHIMIGLLAFNKHVAVWFHKGMLINDPRKLFEKADDKGMRSYKLEEGDEIKEAAFIDLVRKAVVLNAKGIKLTDAKPPRRSLVVPKELEAILDKDETAREHWDKFPYSHRKEYVEWIEEAKRDETRTRRIAEAYQKIREGVGRSDKHKVTS